MNNDIFGIDFTRTLPPALKQDKDIKALSQVIAGELQETVRMIRNNIIYARIDELPEKLLDILAYDFHIDWYNFDYPLESKRELIKNSVKVHQKLGTVYAVETAIRAIHRDSVIEEWFDYGGTPFCFRLVLNLDSGKLNTSLDEIIKKVCMCKRLTAHFEAIYLEKKFQSGLFLGNAQVCIVKLAVPVKEYHKEVMEEEKIRVGIAKIERIVIHVAARKEE